MDACIISHFIGFFFSSCQSVTLGNLRATRVGNIQYSLNPISYLYFRND